MENDGSEPQGIRGSRRLTRVLFALLLLPWLLVPVGLIAASLGVIGHRPPVLDWFDPFFLHYNVFLSLFAVLIVPAIVYFYVRGMKSEKERRLRRDIGDERWEECRQEVSPLIERQFYFPSYVGSLLAAMVVITVGVAIMLLMKPYFPAEVPREAPVPDRYGVNFGHGANILTAGPFVRHYPDPEAKDRPGEEQDEPEEERDETGQEGEERGEARDDAGEERDGLQDFYDQIVAGLTAFQFGFLGAYVYFIGSLLRSYFTLDLSSHTLVAGTVRMVTASVLALVLSFVLPTVFRTDVSSSGFLRALPVIAFFLGYFPNRGLLWLKLWGNRSLGLGRESYHETAVAVLSGMSASHETQLEREGYDNVENLAHADALDLAVRTGFGYRQLRSWIGEARLRLTLGQDFAAFADATWLRTEYKVKELYEAWDGPAEEVTRHLAAACPGMEARIRDLAVLLGLESPGAKASG